MSSVAPFSRSTKTTDVWLTPPELVRSLGEFTLDPCAPPDAPWYHAPIYYTEAIDGSKSGPPSAPSCLVAYGEENAISLEKSNLGYTVRLTR